MFLSSSQDPIFTSFFKGDALATPDFKGDLTEPFWLDCSSELNSVIDAGLDRVCSRPPSTIRSLATGTGSDESVSSCTRELWGTGARVGAPIPDELDHLFRVFNPFCKNEHMDNDDIPPSCFLPSGLLEEDFDEFSSGTPVETGTYQSNVPLLGNELGLALFGYESLDDFVIQNNNTKQFAAPCGDDFSPKYGYKGRTVELPEFEMDWELTSDSGSESDGDSVASVSTPPTPTGCGYSPPVADISKANENVNVVPMITYDGEGIMAGQMHLNGGGVAVAAF